MEHQLQLRQQPGVGHRLYHVRRYLCRQCRFPILHRSREPERVGGQLALHGVQHDGQLHISRHLSRESRRPLGPAGPRLARHRRVRAAPGRGVYCRRSQRIRQMAGRVRRPPHDVRVRHCLERYRRRGPALDQVCAGGRDAGGRVVQDGEGAAGRVGRCHGYVGEGGEGGFSQRPSPGLWVRFWG